MTCPQNSALEEGKKGHRDILSNCFIPNKPHTSLYGTVSPLSSAHCCEISNYEKLWLQALNRLTWHFHNCIISVDSNRTNYPQCIQANTHPNLSYHSR